MVLSAEGGNLEEIASFDSSVFINEKPDLVDVLASLRVVQINRASLGQQKSTPKQR